MLGGKTVVRGAFTVSSYLEGTGTNLRLPVNPPFQQAETLVQYKGVALPTTTTDQGLAPVGSASDPFAGALIRVWDPNVQPALTDQWNLTIQHQLANTATLQVGYIGQHGTHLMVDPEHRNHLGKFRSTLWEIHPITKIEVFSNGEWINLDRQDR